jgi:hypothetical protein
MHTAAHSNDIHHASPERPGFRPLSIHEAVYKQTRGKLTYAMAI